MRDEDDEEKFQRTVAASAAVGLKVNLLKLLEPVQQKVVILQRSIRLHLRRSCRMPSSPSSPWRTGLRNQHACKE